MSRRRSGRDDVAARGEPDLGLRQRSRRTRGEDNVVGGGERGPDVDPAAERDEAGGGVRAPRAPRARPRLDRPRHADRLRPLAAHGRLQLDNPRGLLQVQAAKDGLQLPPRLAGRQRLWRRRVHAVRDVPRAGLSRGRPLLEPLRRALLRPHSPLQRERPRDRGHSRRPADLARPAAQVQEHHHPQQHREVHRCLLDLRDDGRHVTAHLHQDRRRRTGLWRQLSFQRRDNAAGAGLPVPGGLGAERPHTPRLLRVRLPGGARPRQGHLHGRAVLPQPDPDAGAAALRADPRRHRGRLLHSLDALPDVHAARHILRHQHPLGPDDLAGPADPRAQRHQPLDLRVPPRRDARRRGQDRRGPGRAVRRQPQPVRLLPDAPRLPHEPRAGRGERREQRGAPPARRGLLRRQAPPPPPPPPERRLREQALPRRLQHLARGGRRAGLLLRGLPPAGRPRGGHPRPGQDARARVRARPEPRHRLEPQRRQAPQPQVPAGPDLQQDPPPAQAQPAAQAAGPGPGRREVPPGAALRLPVRLLPEPRGRRRRRRRRLLRPGHLVRPGAQRREPAPAAPRARVPAEELHLAADPRLRDEPAPGPVPPAAPADRPDDTLGAAQPTRVPGPAARRAPGGGLRQPEPDRAPRPAERRGLGPRLAARQPRGALGAAAQVRGRRRRGQPARRQHLPRARLDALQLAAALRLEVVRVVAEPGGAADRGRAPGGALPLLLLGLRLPEPQQRQRPQRPDQLPGAVHVLGRAELVAARVLLQRALGARLRGLLHLLRGRRALRRAARAARLPALPLEVQPLERQPRPGQRPGQRRAPGAAEQVDRVHVPEARAEREALRDPEARAEHPQEQAQGQGGRVQGRRWAGAAGDAHAHRRLHAHLRHHRRRGHQGRDRTRRQSLTAASRCQMRPIAPDCDMFLARN